MADTGQPSEFALIERFFHRRVTRDDVPLAIGDDAALIAPPPGQWLAVAIDTLVAGVHFPEDTSPRDIGYKAVAVNLSDMAAMGAQPCWMTLALTLPRSEPMWLESFAQGLFAAAQPYEVALIGGDTTRGPLTISVQIAGSVPPERALRRSGAKAGDDVYVSGTLGDAGLGLAVCQGRVVIAQEDGEYVVSRLNRPSPRVALGIALRGIATGAIDISDGLAADLSHLLNASGVGAILDIPALPLSDALLRIEFVSAREYALFSGDDYELCFTAPPNERARIADIARQLRLPLTRIGHIERDAGLRARDDEGSIYPLIPKGYDHFR